MSAETLREAARLIRERASVGDPQPWACDPDGDGDEIWADYTLGSIGIAAEVDPKWTLHIASWHPAVALAVADWLDACALVQEVAPTRTKANALAVARAYLGDAS